MILDTKEDRENGADWSEFRSAWDDSRLSMTPCMELRLQDGWNILREIRILLIEANHMRHDASVLEEVCNHLSISSHSFDLDSVHNANTRRPAADDCIWRLFPIHESTAWFHQRPYRQKIAD